jgi:outer membrane protein assembly factor BamB
MSRVSCAVALWIVASVATAKEDWTQFRGPKGDGHSSGRDLPVRWGGFDSFAWQAEIPGRGWSSPVVIGDRIWLTSAEATALPTSQQERKLAASAYRDYREQLQTHASVSCLAVEVAAGSGEVLRTIELFTCDDPPPIHASNTYASPTPACDANRLVCHFGSLGTACLELSSGKVLWQRRLMFDEITGPGSSPVIADGVVILPCDGADQQFVHGLDTKTGETVWRTPRPKIDNPSGIARRAFSTALLIEHNSEQQAVVPGAQWVVAYEPLTGREIWRVNMGDCHAIIPRPVYRDGVVYVCTGYMKPQLWAIRVDGRGDVTDTHVVWKHERQVPEISSPIVVGDLIYFVSPLGVLTCLEAATGAVVWQQRLGGNFAASPLYGDGKLYFTSREGLTTVVRPGREYQEIAKNQVFGQTLASLAVNGEALLLRTDRALHCVGKTEQEGKPRQSTIKPIK